MDFRILGNLEVAVGDRILSAGGPREQVVLGVLLLDVGRVVPVARLVDALWPDAPPATAVRQAQNAVSRFRRQIGEPGFTVNAVGGGYRLTIEDGRLDTWLFETKVAEAKRAASAGQLADAAGALREALELRRGRLLEGLAGRVIESAAANWEERHRSAEDAYYEYMLRLGRHRDIVAELGYWAHQVAEHFPDGQLYVNLRGFDPAGPPVATGDALHGFFDAFEVPAARIPESLEAQVSLYRSLMAGRRVLVVLDNARDAEQVSQLLPGASGCLAVVTSRRQLTGLAVAHGAQPITLGMFSGFEARAFLSRRLGAEQIAAETGAVAELIGLCAGLPLALSIVAAQALTRPVLSLAVLASQLRDVTRRLDVLDSGDGATGIRSVISWSYRNLSTEAARMFRLMAMHPGPDISVPAAASLVSL